MMHVLFSAPLEYRYAPHNDVSVNDGPHIQQCIHTIMIL